MNDYTIFYKRELPIHSAWDSHQRWDILISAYVPNVRVTKVFAKAAATHKYWLMFPEYNYTIGDYPSGDVFHGSFDGEATFISDFWTTLPENAPNLRICVDISGFIRPYLIFLVRWLYERGVKRFDAIYSEPEQYHKRELTEFSGDVVKEVRQVAGCEGTHVPDISGDVLIIGTGYEDNLIAHVAENKAKAKKLQLIGFPSLRADMYQENVLRVRRAEESLGGPVDDEFHTFFTPANDPFVTASVLQKIVKRRNLKKRITNLYLCPLSTKAHVLGFTLFYLTECLNDATSIIFPFEEVYSQKTSRGLARIWKYTVELPH